ncbi:hypothetical protein B0T26DRAFT_744056 [Lasiosphaeria miniovina]|uniref:Methyltransferase type 11 domain-containing protein n=1 Tax=Lasiosphaeria miniovina TaxID=1954250 RepID=A0AA40A0H4_9PEZI|nr:uncharacterized protein B0T26DRAFT_744056 [Lasiosphaeria miniovina]KAK0706979.1 hypothetical protein B0T26DRAFT_744056 [Lasiosphaeria miniovina]
MTHSSSSSSSGNAAPEFPPGIPPELGPVRRILEGYSGVPPNEVDSLLYDIRQKSHAVFPYGSIRTFAFLDLGATLSDARFQAAARRLAAPESRETFLDVGCGVGHVVRQLAFTHPELSSSGRLFGTDLHAGFLEIGYELFGDRERMTGGDGAAAFVAGDMLADGSSPLDSRFRGQIDIVYASFFFHLFERAGQVRAAKRMVGFLRRDNARAVIFGQNGGPKVDGWEKYVLDSASWRDMWGEVGEATGTRWRTEMDVEDGDDWIKVRFGVYRAV